MRGWPVVFALAAAACSAPHTSPSSSSGGPDAVNVPAPRPMAPASLSFSTSRVPTFRWELAHGSSGARVEICRDRACDAVVTSFDATGSSGVASTELPAGLVFWRLRGLSAGAAGSTTSVTWELVVPARSAPVATTWGTMLDANGDGVGDVVAGDSNSFQPSQHVYVFLGSAHGPPSAPSSVLSGGSPLLHYAASIASAGDVDGDGYGDLAVGSPTEDTVYFYRGGPSGYSEPPSLVLTGPAQSRFGAAVSSAGDVNGDGYADLVVGAPIQPMGGGSSVVGGARVYLGGPSGLSPTAFVELAPPATSDEQGFGQYVSDAGDMDGDGRGDVAVYGGTGSFDPQRI
ncbi:MAG TPA: integrin alpha, partial [Polyangiaceae bacterium]